MKPDKLHLAASRFERLEESIVQQIATPDWIHLGEPPINWKAEIDEQVKFYNYTVAARLFAVSIVRQFLPKIPPDRLRNYYANTTFQEFFFNTGGRLSFEDDSFIFSFAEHFFEHLWLDETISLLKELHRVMKPNGVLRISVPDADLRTYLPPEPPCYPSVKVPWSHHQKHKMRWNVYSLSETLRISGFQPRPILYSDKAGVLHQPNFSEQWMDELHPETSQLCKRISYLRRHPSLIVDGVCQK